MESWNHVWGIVEIPPSPISVVLFESLMDIRSWVGVRTAFSLDDNIYFPSSIDRAIYHKR